MLSQPVTKVFMRTDEPGAANWISRSIGEIEVMRLEEIRTENIPVFFEPLHRSKSQHWQRRTETPVMASSLWNYLHFAGGCFLKRRYCDPPIVHIELARLQYAPAPSIHPDQIYRRFPCRPTLGGQPI